MGLTEPISDGISAGPMAAGLTDPLGGARLLGRTQTFRDRVQSSGGSIEDEALDNLYDPILRKIKDWGLLSDLVFFGAGSAVENNSGSIATIFDASGNEHDAIQTTTASQPTLDKSGIGGRWTADFDGNDWMYVSFSSTADARTFFCVAEYDSFPHGNTGLWGYQSSARDWQQFVNKNNKDLWGRFYQKDGTKTDFSDSNGPALSANTPFHTVQRADGASTVTQRQNGSQVESISYDGTIRDLDHLMLGNHNNDFSYAQGWDGGIPLWISFETHLSDDQVSEIEKIYTDFYSI
jgi:hypothetical protein